MGGKSSLTPSIARRHSALKEFQETHAWFRPMMDTVGKRLLSKSKFGANFRL